MATLQCEVISNTHETPDVKTLRLKLPSKIRFTPGQFITVRLPGPGGKPVIRAYSISSSPNSPYIDLTYKIVGAATHLMATYEGHTRIEISGPYGNFCWDAKTPNEMVLIAGGVGITPFMSMIRYATEMKSTAKITLFYSCRTCPDIIFREELRKLAEKNPNLRVIFTLTRECPKNFECETGHINEAMIKKYVPDISSPAYFLCGPAPLIDGLQQTMEQIGVPAARISSEKFG